MECEVMSKTYEQIQIDPQVARVVGEMELSGKTYGFHLTELTAAMLDPLLGGLLARDVTLITEAECVKVNKATTAAWVAGDPIFWIEGSSHFTNVDDGAGYLVGKAAKDADQGDDVGYMVMHDYYPVQRGLQIGTSGEPYKMTAALPDPIVSLHTISDMVAVDGNVVPFLVDTVLTGIGATGGRAEFKLSTDVKLGGWANALKAIFDCKATGQVSGLASAFCAEMVQPTGGITHGTYCSLELQLSTESGIPSHKTSLIYANVGGNAKAQFDSAGALLDLHCESIGAAAFVNTNINAVAGGIRIFINNATKWLCYSD
ncbi:unnamed protein product [marine sediment metagenome]|uniref:Uncharacterized protein n=1 Tax=marine sediment metagenome TaxID=412755 RepID=X0SVY3_9ZZZZ